jgi:hypothetical protein
MPGTADLFAGQYAGSALGTGPVDGPATSLVAITPADTDLAKGPCRAIWVGGAGNLSLIAADDGSTTVAILGVPAGTLLPIRAKQIKAATTATSIVALY